MILKKLNDLKTIAAKGPKKRLVLAAAQDPFSLNAVIKAYNDQIIEPILIGRKSEIVALSRDFGYDIANLTIIDEPDMEKAIELSVKMVSNNEADVLMKGKVGTSSLLKAVLNKEWGLRTGNLLSHFALFEVKTYHKLIAVADVAMNIAPNLQDKIAIVDNSVSCLNKLGITMPR